MISVAYEVVVLVSVVAFIWQSFHIKCMWTLEMHRYLVAYEPKLKKIDKITNYFCVFHWIMIAGAFFVNWILGLGVLGWVVSGFVAVHYAFKKPLENSCLAYCVFVLFHNSTMILLGLYILKLVVGYSF